jgi:DNA-binding CsgD family transcriptional regulator
LVDPVPHRSFRTADPVVSGIDLKRLEKACMDLGDAVIDPALWADIIGEIGTAVAATGAALLQGDERTPDIPRSAGVEAVFKRYFAEGWHKADIRAERGVPRALAGHSVVFDQDIVTPEEMRQLPYYNDLLGANGLRWFAATTFRAGPALWALSIQRSIREGPFEGDARPALAQLSQRLTEVATLSAAVGRMVLSGAVDTVNAVRKPAVAIDRFGFVLRANAGAEALFGEEIRIKDRRLCVCDAVAARALGALYDRMRAASDLFPLPCEPIVVRRRHGGPVILRVLPVPPAARGPFLGARALITLTIIVPRTGPQSRLLVGAFGLTPAEARLASIIAEGRDPEHAARELQIATSTARNHLKAIFAKTATRRQSELVALLSRL